MSVSFSNQLTPNNYPTNQRAIIDNNFVQLVALAANSTVANTNAIDLQQATPFPVTEIITVQFLTSASASGSTNSKNINAVLQTTTANSDGTANSGAWANSNILGTFVMTTDNSGVAPLGSVNFKLPPNNARFIRAQFAGESGGGTFAANGTIQILF